MKNYFDSISHYANGYLTETPKKQAVIMNAKIDGRVCILPNSNNRAVTIDDGTTLFLQSYDTLILSIDTFTGKVTKLWDGYSVTTLKHINEFLQGFGLSFNKKSWLEFDGTYLYY